MTRPFWLMSTSLAFAGDSVTAKSNDTVHWASWATGTESDAVLEDVVMTGACTVSLVRCAGPGNSPSLVLGEWWMLGDASDTLVPCLDNDLLEDMLCELVWVAFLGSMGLGV